MELNLRSGTNLLKSVLAESSNGVDQLTIPVKHDTRGSLCAALTWILRVIDTVVIPLIWIGIASDYPYGRLHVVVPIEVVVLPTADIALTVYHCELSKVHEDGWWGVPILAHFHANSNIYLSFGAWIGHWSQGLNSESAFDTEHFVSHITAFGILAKLSSRIVRRADKRDKCSKSDQWRPIEFHVISFFLLDGLRLERGRSMI